MSIGIRAIARPVMLMLLIVVGGPGWPAHGGIIVNWGGNYISGNNGPAVFNGSTFPGPPDQNPNNDSYGDPESDGVYTDANSALSGTITGRNVTENVEYSPVSGGYNQNAKNAVFYGGHSVVYGESTTNVGLTKLEIQNQGPTDSISVAAKPNSELFRMSILTYWKREDFLDGGTGVYTIAPDSYMEIESTQDASNKNTDTHQLRWVVQNNSQFYISDYFHPFTNNGTYNFSLFNKMWIPYDVFGVPAASDPPQVAGERESNLSNIIFNSASASSPVNSSVLTNIQAVGFYVTFARFSERTGASDINYKIQGFDARLNNTIPEPGTFALGLVGVTGAALRRWRKCRGTKKIDLKTDEPDSPNSSEPPAV